VVDGVVESGGTEGRTEPPPTAVIAELCKLNAALAQENARLKHHLELLRRRVFGRRSEQGTAVVTEQGLLPFEPTAAGPVAPTASDEAPDPTVAPAPAAARRRHRGRRALEQALPRRRIEVLPPESAQTCAGCATPKASIGTDVTEELDYEPASFFITEYARPKLACPRCKDGVVQALLPARPLEKGRPGPGLLAQVVTSKYADHLPLYRQEQIFARHDVAISRRTLAEWNGAVADLLQPIVGTIWQEQVFPSPWIQTDDTTLDVQQPGTAGGCRQGHMWVYRGQHGEVVYDFTWARNRDGPLRMLTGYRGYLQADAAPAYDDLFLRHPEIEEVGCWAHARRYFKEAASTAALPCAQVLAAIGELYGVERAATAQGLDAAARQARRQSRARPLLTQLKATLDTLALTALPKSPLGQAVGYARNHWAALTRYTHDGRLKIDNNGAEQALRPIVLGRKNWLFCGSEAAAHRAAILCSLVQTCKHVQVDPFVYLRDVIERVSTHPKSRILELTPREWKRLHADRDRPAV
jgi:transposase